MGGDSNGSPLKKNKTAPKVGRKIESMISLSKEEAKEIKFKIWEEEAF
jgi:hypothetical protein